MGLLGKESKWTGDHKKDFFKDIPTTCSLEDLGILEGLLSQRTTKFKTTEQLIFNHNLQRIFPTKHCQYYLQIIY